MPSDLFTAAGPPTLEWLELGDSRLGLMNGFVDDHDRFYQALVDTLVWEQPSVQLYGKRHRVPRLTAFYGDEGVEYCYSGVTHRATGWPSSLQTLGARIDTLVQSRFNTVLLNWYRDGGDTMGFHADDERSLGPNPVIASVSLGASRRFVIKPRNPALKNRRELILPGGSLLVMAGSFQREWLHAVPAEKGVSAGRINLTFRQVVG